MQQSKPLSAASSKSTARGKIWKFPRIESLEQELLNVVDNSPILAALLKQRGIDSSAKALSFLDHSAYKATSPMELPDVDKALVRINQAIELREHITVFGDYDVDGVTGTSVLLTVLRELGASVDFYIPNRSQEGYGLNLKAVSVLAAKHRTKLIITCDCGVSNFSEINFARSLGVDTLILDHHSMPEHLPPAVGIVHPKLLAESHPLFHLPGVGVAYKVCEAILIDRGLPDRVDALLDYVTLGMIADLVPLVAENRYLVQIGLPKLIKSERPGIQALLAQVKKSDDTDLVGFGLAPRINAVGRLSEAKTAVELLTTNDLKLADELSRQLQTENARRQEICEKIFIEADQMINARADLHSEGAIAIYKEGWHHGVVGIVASRLVEKYGKPVFIAELDREENIVKGSARSVDSVDLFQVLKANEHLMTKWGGHKMAAGFSMAAEKADAWCRAVSDTVARFENGKSQGPSLNIDLIVQEPEVSMDLARLFFKLAPFGMGNKKPLLFLGPLLCQSSRPLGKDGKHHRIMLKGLQNDEVFECVLWNSYGKIPYPEERVDVVFTPESNSFNGRERLQLVLSDWRPSTQIEKLAEGDDAIVRGAPQGMVEVAGMSEVAANKGRQPVPVIQAKAEPAVGSAPDMPVAGMARSLDVTISQPRNFKDLREHSDDQAIVLRAREKFPDDLNIFAEGSLVERGFKTQDRCELSVKSHLIILQFPPSLKVFQEILSRSQAKHVYLLGSERGQFVEINGFIKQLIGIVRYAVGKRDGKVSGEKLAAAFGTTKMAVALGLTLLRKINVIDWYAEDGEIYLDLFGSPEGSMEDLSEYRQLSELLSQIDSFRKWCQAAKVKEIQLATMPNQIELTTRESGTPGALGQISPMAEGTLAYEEIV